MIGPMGGRGVGGMGGGPLGGCLMWAWGMPKAMPVKVAAGNGPMAVARPLTKLDIFSSAPAPKALARAAPGSATVLVMDAAVEAAEFMASAVALALCSPAAIASLRFGGGTGSSGCAGGVCGLALLSFWALLKMYFPESLRPELSCLDLPVSPITRYLLGVPFRVESLQFLAHLQSLIAPPQMS